MPMRAMPVRSLPSRNLVMSQPLFSSPTRQSAGTRTPSRNTSLTSWRPSMVTMGRTVTPGERMSTSSIVMPAWGFAAGSVRTKVNIQSAQWPMPCQVFWPSTT